MNKAIKVEEGQLIIAKDVIKKIKDLVESINESCCERMEGT